MRPTYMSLHLTPEKQYKKGLKPHELRAELTISQPFAAILKI